MANAGSRVPKMEKSCLCIATSPESATLFHTRNTRMGHTGRLANLTSRHFGHHGEHAQRYCGTWADQSRMSSQPLGPYGLAIGKNLGRDAGAIL